ncbi:nuclear pore complex protein Nup133-like [Oppia nitens]|uniref:nuclear pore complex protein Nup133-like n=1 Tax=Oppia nitens TaxID=1686743 RepID=UPI0023DB9C99|nr:nuclear pore complex protein Nup133-like [Oppia nitens]
MSVRKMYGSRRPPTTTTRSPYESSTTSFRSQLSQLAANQSANQSFDTSLNSSSYMRQFNVLDTSVNISANNRFNQSLQLSSQTTTSHLLKSYQTLLPVLVIEAISSDVFSLGSLSVKMSPEGWAWLVCGRRLFVWKYKQDDSSRSCSCYELQLPPSDLSHNADLVCVLDRTQKSQSIPSTIAVTPEGIVRYWPNIAYEEHSIETTAIDLQGQECISLTDIEPYGYILGTTTSSLVHITVNVIDGQNTINCRLLKVPQGVLAGFGRKVSSLLFGSMPATLSSETKQLFKVVRSHSSNLSDEHYIWVLSSVSAQKWHIIDDNTERLIVDMDLERPVKDSFLDKVWNRETTHPNQLKIWLIDIGFTKSDELVLLVAGLNAEVSNQLYYAVITFSDLNIRPETNILFNSFTVLRNHTVCYTEEDEEHLLNLHLLSGAFNNQWVYIYSNTQMLCLKLGSDNIDLIDFNSRDDGILGAGICDGFPLLFTHKDALLSIIPPKPDISDVMDVQTIDEDILPTDDSIHSMAQSQYMPSATDSVENNALNDDNVGVMISNDVLQTDQRLAETDALNQTTGETNFIENEPQLKWLHEIHLDRFDEASETLKNLALDEKNMSRKKTLLSLSKLSALAAGLTVPDEIDMQLELILHQECLPQEIKSNNQLDINSIDEVPQELIEIYSSETNAELVSM